MAIAFNTQDWFSRDYAYDKTIMFKVNIWYKGPDVELFKSICDKVNTHAINTNSSPEYAHCRINEVERYHAFVKYVAKSENLRSELLVITWNRTYRDLHDINTYRVIEIPLDPFTNGRLNYMANFIYDNFINKQNPIVTEIM